MLTDAQKQDALDIAQSVIDDMVVVPRLPDNGAAKWIKSKTYLRCEDLKLSDAEEMANYIYDYLTID